MDAVTITPEYGPRSLTAVWLWCAGCKERWPARQTRGAAKGWTDAGLNRQVEEHWRSCPARGEPPVTAQQALRQAQQEG